MKARYKHTNLIVKKALDIVQQHDGRPLGEIVSQGIASVGLLTFVYATDPKGNVIELQHWQ